MTRKAEEIIILLEVLLAVLFVGMGILGHIFGGDPIAIWSCLGIGGSVLLLVLFPYLVEANK